MALERRRRSEVLEVIVGMRTVFLRSLTAYKIGDAALLAQMGSTLDTGGREAAVRVTHPFSVCGLPA
jgi:hypothetical protein